jgi:hypothetical protein
MKNFYLHLSFFTLLASGLAACQKNTGDDGSASTTGKLDKTSAEYQRVVKDPQFLGACEVMTADGEMFDENSAIYARKNGGYEISFAVINETTLKPGHFQKLVYANDGLNTVVYFDDKNPSDTSVTGSQKLQWPPKWWPGGGGSGSGGGSGGGYGSGFCWQWTSWSIISYNCSYSFSCFFNNQKAKFKVEQRTCRTNPSNVQTRTVKLHCGC